MAGRGRGRPVPSWMQQGVQGAPGGAAGRGGVVPPPPPPRAAPAGGAGGSAPAMSFAPMRQMPGMQQPQQQQQQPAPANFQNSQSGWSQPGAAQAAAGGAAPGASKVDIPACDWTEHTAPDGRKYYYNAKTKVSAWVKPPEFAQWEEAKKTAATAAAATMSGEQELKCEWRECTADSGQKYYYNSTTKKSVWEVPPEFVVYKELLAKREEEKKAKLNPPAAAAATSAPAAPSNNSTAATTGSPGPKLSKSDKKEEAREAFKELLREYGFDSNKQWEQILPKIVSEARYKNKSLKLQEKKQMFEEYRTARRQEEREERRRSEKKLRDNFMAMLEEVKVSSTTTLAQLQESCGEDPRFKALDDRSREDYFDQYVAAEEKNEEEKRQAERKEASDALRATLEALVAKEEVTVTTTWEEAQALLDDDASFTALDKKTRLDLWDECIRKVERDVFDAKRRRDTEKRRTERKRREAFRAVLKEALASGDLTARTRWKEFVKGHILPDEARSKLYVEMAGQAGSTPRDLFRDVVDDLDDDLHSHAKEVRELFRDVGFTVGAKTPETDFMDAVSKGDLDIPRKDLSLIFNDLVLKAEYEQKQEERRRQRSDGSDDDDRRHRSRRGKRSRRDGDSGRGGDRSYSGSDDGGDDRGERRRKHRSKKGRRRHHSSPSGKSKHKRKHRKRSREDKNDGGSSGGDEPPAKRARDGDDDKANDDDRSGGDDDPSASGRRSGSRQD